MSTRATMTERLSGVPTTEILGLLDDDTIYELASRYFQQVARAQRESDQAVDGAQGSPTAASPTSPKDKAKRPLNAFMAFRSYYLKMFPDVQQKAVSGFLTLLWNQDPFRNRWALIAKVYSFIRDQIGKDKIPLSHFLSICCPMMKIIGPTAYLDTLGWHVDHEDEAAQKLVRHDPSAGPTTIELQSQEFPSSELDLLLSVLDVGLFPAHGSDLIERMSANNNGLMTTTTGTTARPPVPFTLEKLQFLSTVQENPMKAARELFGDHFEESIVRDSGYRLHNVQDLRDVSEVPLQQPVDPTAYSYPATHNPLGLGGEPVFKTQDYPEQEWFDIGNPYDMENMLGFSEPAADGEHGESPPFSSIEDFQFMY